MNRCRRYSSHFAWNLQVLDPRSPHDPGSGVSVVRIRRQCNTDKNLPSTYYKYFNNKQIMLEQSRKKSLRNTKWYLSTSILSSSPLTFSAKTHSSNLYNMAKKYALSLPEFFANHHHLNMTVLHTCHRRLTTCRTWQRIREASLTFVDTIYINIPSGVCSEITSPAL